MRVAWHVAAWAMVLACCSGCGTTYRGMTSDYDKRYWATKYDLGISRPPDTADMYAVYPFPWIDLPFALVFETITFPFDQAHYSRSMREMAFWRDALKTNAVTLLFSDYERHFTEAGMRALSGRLDHGDASPELLDVVYELCVTNCLKGGQNMLIGSYPRSLLEDLSRNPNLSSNTVAKMYALGRANKNFSFLLPAVAASPKTPPADLKALAQGPVDYGVYGALARSAATPADVLEQVTQKAFALIQGELDKPVGARSWEPTQAALSMLEGIAQRNTSPPELRKSIEARLRSILDAANTRETNPFPASSDWDRARGIVKTAQYKLAMDPNSPPEWLEEFAEHPADDQVLFALTRNPRTPASVLQKASTLKK